MNTGVASVQDWLEGARLRTLPAAASPVLVGMGAAACMSRFSIGLSLLALTVALALQVGVNFANDYSDGIRGTDAQRVGPIRLTASGTVSPRNVLAAALSCFAIAGVAGLIVVVWTGLWWLLLAGAVAIVAAWYYTGGKHPYGYSGFGLSEILVFVFFGLMATVGTTFVQSLSAPWWLWVAASGIGLASIGLLMVNNIRDIATDRQVGKLTLAVRLGRERSQVLFVALMILSAASSGVAVRGAGNPWYWSLACFLLLLLCAAPATLQLLRGASGAGLLLVLRNCGLYVLALGVLTAVALAFGASEAL